MRQPAQRLTRRAVLRGLGATVALPWLESLAAGWPAPARRTWTGSDGAAGDPRAGVPPTRLAILYMANGVYPPAWAPTGGGREFELSKTLAPLQALKSELTIFGNLHHANSRDGDGHYAKTAPFLTGAKIRRTGGRDLENGVSLDQVIAAAIGERTPLPSLELGTEPVRPVEDMGYSTVYGGHISWRTPTEPATKEIVPRLVFDRLFRSSRLREQPGETSVLDVVRDDARRLERTLGRTDRQKLDEYLDSVRALERRIDRCAGGGAEAGRGVGDADAPPPGRPQSHPEHVRLMLDLIVLAFRTDSTRVATFMFGNAVSGIDMSFLDGVKGGHHELSHHENRPEKFEPYQRINQWHVAEYARMLEQMRGIADGEEGTGTLLDHSLILFASALRDGNAHESHDLPIVLAGRGGGVETGRFLNQASPTPLCNLWLSVLHRMGVAVERFGDSTGALI